MAALNRLCLLIRTVILLFVLFAGVISNAQSTTAPLLEKRISIVFNGEPADVALKRVAAAGEFNFSYSPTILEKVGNTHGTLSDVSIRECLDHLFSGRVTYRERSNYIILTARPVDAEGGGQRQIVLTGYVTDVRNGERIAAATIVERQSLTAANSDAYGFFSIKIDKPVWPLTLQAYKVDYNEGAASITSPSQATTGINLTMQKSLVQPIASRSPTFLATTPGDSVYDPLPMEMPALTNRALVMTNVEDTLYRKWQLSFLPFVGTNQLLSGNVVNDYSVNLIGGYSFGNRKAEFGGVFNASRADVEGFQAAGVFNLVYGGANAVQLAGVGNLNRGPSGKLKMAGVMNIQGNHLDGTAIAGVFNYSHKSTRGLSLAGVFNHQNGHCDGAQVAGVFNVAPAGITKGQLAGVFNASAKEVGGAQVAGVMNVAAGHVRGAQVAGVLNVAKTVGGTQVGLVNFCDSIEGVPLGFLSYVHSGYHHLEVAADETFPVNVALYTGVRAFHNIFTAGINPRPGQSWYYGYGVGTAPRLGNKVDLNIQVTANWINEDALPKFNLLGRFALGADYRFHKNFSVHGAAVLNGLFANEGSEFPERVIPDQAEVFYESNYGNDFLLQVYPGARLALRYRW